MKHVIVIETPDDLNLIRTATHRRTFEHQVSLAAEAMATFLTEKPAFIQTRFFVDSAITAIHEMYNAPEWKAGL